MRWDRTQPGLPMKNGRADTITHDYKRRGVTTLFAALDVLEGKGHRPMLKHHRHQEFIRSQRHQRRYPTRKRCM